MARGQDPDVKVIRVRPSRHESGRRWWEEHEDDIYRAVFAAVRDIAQNQHERDLHHADWSRMYAADVSPNLRDTIDTSVRPSRKRLSYNVVRSCVRTACSKIAKNKPKPQFLTSGGAWSLQQKAKKLTKFVEGRFGEIDLYAQAQNAFRDSTIFDGGVVKFWREGWRHKCARVHPGEILVDQYEACESQGGKPLTMHHRRVAERSRLRALYPDKADAISKASSVTAVAAERSQQSNMIAVVESWHLPSGPDAGDGVHVVAIENETLFYEEWKHDWFPFLFLFWDLPVDGFWGRGIAAGLSGLQGEITDLLYRIQTSQKYVCAPKVFIAKGSKIVKAHFNNDLRGTVIEYSGPTPPQFVTPQAMSPEVYQQLETYVRRAYEEEGISQLSANAQKPAGVDSAVALREVQDIESTTFVIIAQRYEQFFIDAAKILIVLEREMMADFDDLKRRAKKSDKLKDELARAERGLRVKSLAGKFIESIEWRDVDMDDDEYDIKIFPISMLPTSPAGRLQTITEMMKVLGADGQPMISGEQAMMLLDFPDLEDIAGEKTASITVVRKMLSDMLEGGEFQMPEPELDLMLAKNLAQLEYLRAKSEGAPEDALEKLRQFMGACRDMIAFAQNQAAPANTNGLPPDPPPGAPPMPPPPPAPPPMN